MMIRLCLVPLFVKQVHAQRKMAQHAPQLQELRKKYKNDKQRLNEETMKFYKENGVNPLAGCLPMIPQMIVFFSLFSVLRAIADWVRVTLLQYGLHGAGGGERQGGDDLRRSPGRQAAVLAPVRAAARGHRDRADRGGQRDDDVHDRPAEREAWSMQTNVDPDNPMAQSQKFMQYIVPFFSLTGLYWQYGLVLYWVTTNLWTLGQQYFMFRNWNTQPVGAEGAVGGATTGGPVKTTQNSSRAGSARPGGSGQAPARPASGAAKTAASGARNGTARAGTASGRPAAQGSASARAKDGTTSASARPRAAPTSASARTGTACPPGGHAPPGRQPERHGKARAAETGPGERTRAPGRRAHR